ncbi:RNA polymerase sigma factor [Engelhardtia mirabilis]|uniref:ECF RNA polymerase sigma factor SigD n=1 Tax=Engelhardtia mirabilis TaxID=2528011 RepID=A0A518BFN9_9BACT|nr:ECF RNA polymerase sigma factor SigD [Planctomycetes bacterium Pla133]QDV00125.1 ECF RNA polymerase sigma factor SigD [Planctomycetes bacterium Pla86]
MTEGDSEPAPDMEALLAQGLPALRTFVRLRLAPALRARESVEDVVQSTCREVLESAEGFKGGGEAGFRRWIYTLAQRKIADRWAYHRAQKRDIGREAGGGDDLLLDQYAGLAGPGTQVASLEELRAIEAAFDRLREEDREVISLVRVLGMSAADAGACLDKNAGAVRTSLHRALARLAEELERGPG